MAIVNKVFRKNTILINILTFKYSYVLYAYIPKIKNWSRDDNAYPCWIHDETNQTIEIGIDSAERREDGKPKKYQITAWNGLNCRTLDFSISSLDKAMNSARNIAKENPNGQLVKSIKEEHNFY